MHRIISLEYTKSAQNSLYKEFSYDKTFVASVINDLGNQLSLKDMGSLHFFLRVEAIPTCVGLFLSQHKYICELLESMEKASAKDVSTFLSTSTPLHLMDETTAVDDHQYYKVIGSLQYLSLTHSGISFAINKLSQFMHKPTTTH